MKGPPPGIATTAPLQLVNGVWQSGSTFPLEEPYHRIRAQEGRSLDDAIVSALPATGNRTAHAGEWLARKASMERLLKHFRKQGRGLTVLDVGCGNGWLAARLAREGHEVVGIDVHRFELEQAARVFTSDHLWFVHGDLLELPFMPGSFDRVIFAASIQYFGDLRRTLDRALALTAPGGEIHVLDSPFYEDELRRSNAADRSSRYFADRKANAMTGFYHHHLLSSLAIPGAAVSVHKVSRVAPLLRRMGWVMPAFPHVIIRSQDQRPGPR